MRERLRLLLTKKKAKCKNFTKKEPTPATPPSQQNHSAIKRTKSSPVTSKNTETRANPVKTTLAKSANVNKLVDFIEGKSEKKTSQQKSAASLKKQEKRARQKLRKVSQFY